MMTEEKERIDKYLFIVFVMGVGLTKGGPELIFIPPFVGKIMLLMGMAALFAKIIRTKYTKQEYISNGIICVIAGISTLYTHRFGLIVIAVLFVGSKGILLKQQLKIFLALHIAFLTLAVVPELIYVATGGSFHGLFYEKREIYGVVQMEQQFRYSMGFTHPNALQQCICFITILTLTIYHPPLRALQLAIIAVFNIGFYFITYSNTGISIFILFFIFYILANKFENFIIPIAKYSHYLFLLLTALNMLLVITYSSKGLLEKINHIMVYRLYYAHEYLKALGLSLWGRDIADAGIPYTVIDNSFTSTLLRYGIVIFLIYIAVVCSLLKYLYQKKLIMEIILIGVLHVYLIMENFMMAGLINLTYPILAAALYSGDFFNKRHIHKLPAR